MESMVIIAGYVIVDEPDRSDFVDADRDLVSRARAFEGCMDLSISPDPVDPRRINTLEVWESPEALDKWRAQADAPGLGNAIQDAQMQRFDATDGGPLF